MCTLTWRFAPEGYELLFNRDELRTRSIASPPTKQRRNQTRYIAPTDTDSGGTWIGVNEYGLTLCLLNHYPSPSQTPFPSRRRSRGLLVPHLMEAPSIAKAQSRLESLDLSVYPSFVLGLFAPAQPVQTYTWDSQSEYLTQKHHPEPPLSSSSFASATVVKGRKLEYAHRRMFSFTGTSNQLWAYHHSHKPEPGPFSVCMHRPDAQTVSLSHIKVNQSTIGFTYKPGPPCSTLPLAPVVLKRPKTL